MHCCACFTDLIQEDRSFLGNFKKALAVRCRSRKRTFDISEQLGLQQSLRQRATVDRHERLLNPGTVQVDRLRGEFFTRTALTGNQDRTIRIADDLDHAIQLLHFFAATDQAAHSVLLLELPFKVGVFLTQAPFFQRTDDDVLQLVHEVVGLQDVVERSHLEGLDRSVCGRVGGQQYEFARRSGRTDTPQQLDASHVGHLDI